MLDKSAIILAGGNAARFGEDKGTVMLGNKPLIRHVYDNIQDIVDEVIVVTKNQLRADQYAKLLPEKVNFIIDSEETQGPLIGALTGFKEAQGKYSILLPFDAPFVSKEVAMLLFDLCVGKAATVPRNPDNEIEPLCAVYQTMRALETARQLTAEGVLDMHSLVENLRGVRFISTMVIEQIDPELRSFFNVNTPLDLKRAVVMLQGPKKHQIKHKAKKNR